MKLITSRAGSIQEDVRPPDDAGTLDALHNGMTNWAWFALELYMKSKTNKESAAPDDSVGPGALGLRAYDPSVL